MTPERFEALARAWGGDIGRWPPHEQSGARDLLGRDPAATRSLHAAAELDAALDASPVSTASEALRRAVLATAPRPRRALRAASAWLSGVGLLGACAAGVACGFVVAEPRARDAGTEAVVQAAADVGATLAPVDFGGRDV